MSTFHKIVALGMGAPLTQRIVQRKVEKGLRQNPMITVRHNIVRSLFGNGNRPMEEMLAETAKSRARIIMLIAGVDNERGDIAKHAFPAWFGITQRDKEALIGLQRLLHGLDEQGEEVVAAANEKLGLDELRKEVAFAEENPVNKGTLEEYQTVVLRKVQERIYGQTRADVSIVVNANIDDFLQTIKHGGGNTTMITHAHADRVGVSMTDGAILSENIPSPEKKLGAFLMHGCGDASTEKDEERDVMGTGLAEEVWTPKGSVILNHLIRNPFLRG